MITHLLDVVVVDVAPISNDASESIDDVINGRDVAGVLGLAEVVYESCYGQHSLLAERFFLQ